MKILEEMRDDLSKLLEVATGMINKDGLAKFADRAEPKLKGWVKTLDLAIKENIRLIKLLEGEPILKSMSFTQEDGLDMTVKHWACYQLAHSFIESLGGSPNFVTMVLTLKEPTPKSSTGIPLCPRRVRVTVKWEHGESPEEQLSRAVSLLTPEQLAVYTDNGKRAAMSKSDPALLASLNVVPTQESDANGSQ